jgi:hypothetical protein
MTRMILSKIRPNMKIALIQAELIWENPEANRVYFEENKMQLLMM